MNSSRRTFALRPHLLWLALPAALLVLFPFGWLATVWPAYRHLFDLVFASEVQHVIGHMVVFALAGLVLLSVLPQLRRHPFYYALLMALGAIGNEGFQAVAGLHVLNSYTPVAFCFDALGFTLAFVLGQWKHMWKAR